MTHRVVNPPGEHTHKPRYSVPFFRTLRASRDQTSCPVTLYDVCGWPLPVAATSRSVFSGDRNEAGNRYLAFEAQVERLDDATAESGIAAKRLD